MATHFSILAWRFPWTEEPGRLQSLGGKESDTAEQLTFIFDVVAQSPIVSDSLRPHGLQHVRPPCPSSLDMHNEMFVDEMV